MTCPDADTLLQCFAGHLVDEDAAKVRAHAAGCPSCQAALASLQRLTQPLATDDGLPPSTLTVDGVVAAALAAEAPRARGAPSWLIAVAAAVVVLAGVTLVVRSRESTDGTFTARGTATPWRERVSARVVAGAAGLVEPGAHVAADAPFTVAAFGVSATDSLHLLAFLVDAKGEVHWVAPQWLEEAQVPVAPKLTRDGGVFTESPGGAVLGLESSVVFDDLPAGPAVVLTVVAEDAPSVLAIERLASRTEAAVKDKVPQALVRAVPVVIDGPRSPKPPEAP